MEKPKSMTSERLPWIGEGPSSQKLFELAQRVAPVPTTVLITGESGTGKDYLARLIHELSPRRDAPYLKIDCADLPPTLVESELFGHERGAISGAGERKLGRFEISGKGTVVLDEVAALTLAVQTKLARVLQERKFERLGSKETQGLDARLIALTNTDLSASVKDGRFHEDLYQRFDVAKIWLPPLRERTADILPLANHLLAGLRARHGKLQLKLSEAAKAALRNYKWPGNVRELGNALEHAVLSAAGEAVEPENFPEYVRIVGSNHGAMGNRSLEDVEREAIEATLKATRNQIGRSAGILGISRKTLLEKRKKYGWV
jgi:two-component system, NtrC family, response regulator AtoC